MMNMDNAYYKERFFYKLIKQRFFSLTGLAGVVSLVLYGLGLGTFFLWLGLGVLAGGGLYFAGSMLLGNKAIDRQIREEVDRQAIRERNRQLDKLERELRRDDDPRTENTLRDLRALSDAFSQAGLAGMEQNVSGEKLGDTVHQMIGQSIQLLRQSLTFNEPARQAASQEIRQSILAKREAVLSEAIAGVEILKQVLDKIQTVAASSLATEQVTQMGQQMLDQLEIARSVEERMNAAGLGQEFIKTMEDTLPENERK